MPNDTTTSLIISPIEDSELLADVSDALLANPDVSSLHELLKKSAAETLLSHYYSSMCAGSWFNVLPQSLLNGALTGGIIIGATGGGGNPGAGNNSTGGGVNESKKQLSQAPLQQQLSQQQQQQPQQQQLLPSSNLGNKPSWRFCRLADDKKEIHLSKEFSDFPGPDYKPKPEEILTKIELSAIKDIRVSMLPPLIAQQLGLSSLAIGSGGNGGPSSRGFCELSVSGSGTSSIANISFSGFNGNGNEVVFTELVCTSPHTTCEWTDGMRQLLGRPMSNLETTGLVSAASAVQLRVRLLGFPMHSLDKISKPVIPPLPLDANFYFAHNFSAQPVASNSNTLNQAAILSE